MMKSPTRLSLPVPRELRRSLGFPDDRYDKRGRLRINTPREARELAAGLGALSGGVPPSAADIYGAAWIYAAWRRLLNLYGEGEDPFEPGAIEALEKALGSEDRDAALADIAATFPDDAVWHGRRTPREAAQRKAQRRAERRLSGQERTIRNGVLANLGAENPAFAPFRQLFGGSGAQSLPLTESALDALERHDAERLPRAPEDAPPLATLRRPIQAAPFSVKDQLLYILTRWGQVLGDWAAGFAGALDMIEEEHRPRFGHGPGPIQAPGFDGLDGAARFSDDVDWMPRVVMVAKNVLVWLHQLSTSYDRDIRTLDAVPDEELDVLAARGFNALWLIGLWERSAASREIKRRMGNPEAAASAYSLFGYDIDPDLGGWEALDNLRHRAEHRGIRLSSDMVPNHVGIDSDWVRHHPERLLSVDACPYPAYGWNSENLSGDPGTDIRLEDHYWDRTDAAVVFRRTDTATGESRYVYHGNDGTSMPWNDTAQIDFLNPEAREAVIRDIVHVARNFPIIRFDAAMVLARKSIRRLWFPPPGAGGAIPSRSEHALSDAEFDAACPGEFWRDVVDRVAAEVPGTLLLAEAFWMMEGYFVRALGMHRVYNSAFMNMLRDGKNREYRDMMKETLAFDPGILQRFVNFMNNPDEETAVEQFGRDDRYFAACTLLATLPGLPMFGHGQIEGLSEKYGMEYIRAYRDEHPDSDLIARHEREVFPLIRRRSLFSGARSFRLYDLMNGGTSNDDVFAYSNADSNERVLVLVNNGPQAAHGRIRLAAPVKTGDETIQDADVADALVPRHLDDGDWVLLREFIAGHWFLRSIGDLRRDGLNVAVDGYGRQLFLDLRYEKESSDGIWGRLAAELAGRAVEDPDDAVRELRLRPLRTALGAIIDESLVGSLADEMVRGRIPSWPDRSEAIAEFVRIHRELTGRGGQADPSMLNRAVRGRLAAASRLFRFPARGLLRRAAGLFGGKDRREEAAFLVLWSAIAPLASMDGLESASANRQEWGLGRWLSSDTMVALIPEAENRIAAASAGTTAGIGAMDPASTLSHLMADPGFRSACGVHTWNDTIWFNQEGWARSIRSVVLADASVPRRLISRIRRRRSLHRSCREWHRAAAGSDYHVDRLLQKAR